MNATLDGMGPSVAWISVGLGTLPVMCQYTDIYADMA